MYTNVPGNDGTPYRVNIRRGSSPLVEGILDFDVSSEQYYVHVDPANEVLATTRFPVANYYHAANGEVDVPVAWTRRWGHGSKQKRNEYRRNWLNFGRTGDSSHTAYSSFGLPA